MLTVIVGIYFICAVLLMVYGVNSHVMTCLFKRRFPQCARNDRELIAAFYNGAVPDGDLDRWAGKLPVVTTQLPIFNELNVAERLVDAVCAFRYPDGRHEIQVLDDSTDETRAIVAARVRAWRQKGVDIHHITRPDRQGFKAGALRYGLARARGRYLAIFDADFVPPPDFLLRAIPFFLQQPNIGFVQARWGHLNSSASLVTRLQAIGINGHFMVEQAARNTNNLFMNFNGTAGIFDRQAILEAGNWHDDTLTEDMDLSYRIQLKGWRCRYLIDLEAPAEIPADINAFKSQQFRWAKGSIQTAMKLGFRVMRSPAGWFAKLQAFMHLTHYLIHPLMLFLALMALPILASDYPALPAMLMLLFGLLLCLSCTGPSRLYFTAERALNRSPVKLLALLPLMICFGCGLAVNNTRAVIEAVFRRRSAFIRTPKQGFARKKRYRVIRDHTFLVEIFTGLWCLAGVLAYFNNSQYLVGHFLLLYALGFLGIGVLSWQHQRKG